MIEQLKAGLIGLVIGGILAFAGGWWVRGYEVKAVKVELQAARDANSASQATITAQKEEIEKAAASCKARIESKDKTLSRLKAIDNLQAGGTDEEGNISGSDPILDELNRMRKAARKD